MWLVVLSCAVVAAVVIGELVRRRLVGRSLEHAMRTYSPAPAVRVLRDEAELRRAVTRAVSAEWAVALRAAGRAERLACLVGDPSLAPLGEAGKGATLHQIDGRPRPWDSRQPALGPTTTRGSGGRPRPERARDSLARRGTTSTTGRRSSST
jgi:hypothetical protein